MKTELERTAITKALQEQPTITKAAKALGASRRTLQSRMRDYGIAPGKAGRPRALLPKAAKALTGSSLPTLAAFVGLGLGAWWLLKPRKQTGLDLLGVY